MIVIPSLNIDGFMQTQRYPSLNYLQSDPDDPNDSPRDGRMRRKNMLSADEDLYTTWDHLNGVDLNRNNGPLWASNPARSSPDLRSIVHHGAGPASEPEIQALDAAAQLGPGSSLRIFTDVHSFSLVSFWVRGNDLRLAQQTEEVLSTFRDHHASFPAGKRYLFDSLYSIAMNSGIGSTDEYFTYNYNVPAWTLEVEPSGGQPFHSPLPGGGADYGGSGENGHDGFILPESEIRRVREELAQSFAAVYYRQAGPPAIQSVRLIDRDTRAVIYEADWDVVDEQTRSLYSKQLQAVQFNHSYDLWLSFNKPMRWREDGLVVTFPGQPASSVVVWANALVGDSFLTTNIAETAWLNQPGKAPDGYMNYQDDAARVTFSLPDDEQNLGLVSGDTLATLRLRATDMTGMTTDANPGTIVRWVQGSWRGYEDDHEDQTDSGGSDNTLSLQVTNAVVPPPFLLEAGITSSWYDPSHDGEGFLIELLANDVAVMFWFTYDDEGNQDWYVATGKVIGNRIEFPEIYTASGGVFGPEFDPGNITREIIGSASFIWSGCDEGSMSYQIGAQHGHMQLSRLTRLMGIECGMAPMPPVREEALLSGPWYDPTHDGEGYIVEVLDDSRVVVFWFSFGPDGKRRWFYDDGEIVDGKLVFDEMLTTRGGVFGPEFDPQAVEQTPWGTLELDLDCNGGTATYNSTEQGFGAGVLNVVRLTSISQLACP